MEFGFFDLFPPALFLLLGAVLFLKLAWGQAGLMGAREIWRRVGVRLGLELTASHALARPRLGGTLDGLKVTVDTVRRGGRHKRTYTRVMVEIDHPPAGLTAGREDLFTQLGGAFGLGDLTVGDPEFDRAVRLAGAEAPVVALFDATRRQRLRGFVAAERGRIEKGLVVLEVPKMVAEEEPLAECIRHVVEVAREFSLAGVRLPARLRQNALEDPLPAVRRRNLEILLRDFPDAPERAEACRAVLADPQAPPDLVFLAGRPLGPEGWPAVDRLAFTPGLEPALAASALRHLAMELTGERRVALLERAMESEAVVLAREARDRLVLDGHQPPAETLLRWLAAPAPETVAYAAERIVLFPGAPAEGPLLAALARPEPGVRLAATTALARCGTLVAVEPLQRTARAAPVLDGGLRAAVRAAIHEIQARLGDAAGAGHLSLASATGEAGALSLARRDAGEITLAAEPAAAEVAPLPLPLPAAAAPEARPHSGPAPEKV